MIHDARRNEAYLLLKDDDTIILPPVVLPFAEAVTRIRAFGPCVVAGTARRRRAKVLGDGFCCLHPPTRRVVGGAPGPCNAAPKDAPGPLYLRAARRQAAG